MSNTKHTPGPWRMSPERGKSDEYRVYAPEFDAPIAEVSMIRANAILIAAAPELLRALKSIVASDEKCHGVVHAWAKTIIAKAEGQD